MRRLIATALFFALAAGTAHAQNAMVCAHYATLWANVSAGGNSRAMRSLADSIPDKCPVKAVAERKLAALKKPPASPVKPPHPGPPDVDRPGAGAGDDQLASATPPPINAPPPVSGPPPAPCSVAAVDAEDSGIPDDGPDPSLSGKNREALSERYARRAEAFRLCGDRTNALNWYRIAVAEDTQRFETVYDRAGYYLDNHDYPNAIADYGTAIALKDHAPDDQTALAVYGNRAEAEAALKQYKSEIADLQFVVDHFNEQLHDQLKPYATYNERLAKAYYHDGDYVDAEAGYKNLSFSDLDWEDLWFVANLRAKSQNWDGVIQALTAAQGKLPPALQGDDGRVQRALIEVMLAQAYQARGHLGDARSAWDSFKSAKDDDPSNHEAQAGLASLGPIPEKPTFQEPALETVVMPAGVSNLDHDEPGPFCGALQKNDYLDSVSRATSAVNDNITTLGDYVADLLARRAKYNDAAMLTPKEKIDYLHLFDEEWTKVKADDTDLRKTGYALGNFFNRIKSDESVVVPCDKDGVPLPKR